MRPTCGSDGGYSFKLALCPCSPFSLKCLSMLLENLFSYDIMAGRLYVGKYHQDWALAPSEEAPDPGKRQEGHSTHVESKSPTLGAHHLVRDL